MPRRCGTTWSGPRTSWSTPRTGARPERGSPPPAPPPGSQQCALVVEPVDEGTCGHRRAVDEFHQQPVVHPAEQWYLYLGEERQVAALVRVTDVRLAEAAGVVPLVDRAVGAVRPLGRHGGVRAPPHPQNRRGRPLRGGEP